MSQLYLFARVAGTRIAVQTDEVEAVVKLTDIAPVPGMPPHIAGLSALRSRVLTVIDVAALILGRQSERSETPLAIIANIAGHSYGLMVESVSDICSVPGGELPLRGQLDPAFAPYVRAIIENGEGANLLVNMASFVEGGAAQPAIAA